jgi:hypothetical protein
LAAPFFTRRSVHGKQLWKTLSATTFKQAKEEAAQLTADLDAHAKGLTVAEADSITNANRNPIRTAVDTYLEQKSGKAKKTVAQYLLTLNEFIEALQGKVRFLHEITENVLCSYKKFMVNQGYAGKTIDTRLNMQRLFDVVAEMKKNAEPISITALQSKGFDKEVLVEIGGEASAFDAFHPDGSVIDGKYVPLSKLGLEHL